MPTWPKALGKGDALGKLLRLIAEQGDGNTRSSAQASGKGKGKGTSKSNQGTGAGAGQRRPSTHGEQLYAGRTAQEVANIIDQGGWIGLRQFGKHRGNIYTGTFKEGDLSCSRCGSATCRPWKPNCWICGATLPKAGQAKEAPRKQTCGRDGKAGEQSEEDHDSDDGCDAFVLPKAAEMASLKKRPPSTVATVLASATLKAGSTYADAVTHNPPAVDQPPSPPSAGPPPPAADPYLLSGAAMGQVKALLASLPPGVEERKGLVHILERHKEAEAKQKRQAAEAKSDTVDFSDKTYEFVLAHHESQLANLRKRAAENAARRDADQTKRRQETERDRATLQRAVDQTRKELEDFEELTAVRTAEWEATEQAKSADLQEQIERTTEEVSRAKAALLAAPAPNTKRGQGGAAGSGKGTEAGAGRDEDGSRGRNGDGMERADASQPPAPKPFTPLIDPPKLQPPADPAALARLQHAHTVHRAWSVQEGDPPLTPAMLGLTILELSQLVGNDIWSKSPLVSDQAAMPRSLANSMSIALNGLEVAVAAQTAAREAVRQYMETQQTTGTTLTTPTEGDDVQARPGKHARTGPATEPNAGADVEMQSAEL